MRVVIVGLGKSGTTALLYAVRSAMPADTQLLFEPRSYVKLQSRDVVAKVLLNPRFPIEHAFYRQFDRIVLLVRDPRDLLISKALYRVFGARSLHADPAKLNQYIDLLRAKEADPRSVSLTQINAIFERIISERNRKATEKRSEGITAAENIRSESEAKISVDLANAKARNDEKRGEDAERAPHAEESRAISRS